MGIIEAQQSGMSLSLGLVWERARSEAKPKAVKGRWRRKSSERWLRIEVAEVDGRVVGSGRHGRLYFFFLESILLCICKPLKNYIVDE